jgi:hypothetical protein
VYTIFFLSVVSSEGIFPSLRSRNSSPSILGCDVVLPVKSLIPGLVDHIKNGVEVSNDTRIEIQFRKHSEPWSVTSNTPVLSASPEINLGGRKSLALPVDGGTFWLKLRTITLCRFSKSKRQWAQCKIAIQ